MIFFKTAFFSVTLNFIIISFASAYYFAIPQVYLSRSKAFATLYYRCTSCSTAEQNAIIDFKNEDYLIIWWGLGDYKFDKVFESMMASKYKIKSTRGGCIALPEMDCYNIKMRHLLFKKFGNNFMSNCYKKADSLNKLPQTIKHNFCFLLWFNT